MPSHLLVADLALNECVGAGSGSEAAQQHSLQHCKVHSALILHRTPSSRSAAIDLSATVAI